MRRRSGHRSPRPKHRETESRTVPPMDVVLLRWPEESVRSRQLETRGVAPSAAREPGEPAARLDRPPRGLDPAAGRRPATSGPGSPARRPVRAEQPAPKVDDDGLLWFRGRWVSLSPVERRSRTRCSSGSAPWSAATPGPPGVAGRQPDPQRARRPHGPPAAPDRDARARGPHRAVPGLPAAGGSKPTRSEAP